MLINGRDLDLDGFLLVGLSGWASPPAWQRTVTALPDVHGVVPATRTTVDVRQMRMVVRIMCSTLSERQTKLQTLQDRISGLLTLRFDDWPGRVVRALAGAISVASVDPGGAFAIPAIEVTIPLVAYDGASYDAEPRVLALTTTPAAVSVGTLPSTGVLRLDGSWSAGASRTVTVRHANGQSTATLTFTAPTGQSLAAADVLEIDLSRRYVTKVTGAGVRTNAYSWKASGNWFGVDPAWGDRATSRFPTLELSTGTGTFLYRPTYAL
jgi:hypothetical protein